MDDSSTSLARLDAKVSGACKGQREWPAKVAASIYAALDFAVAEPAAARELTIDLRSTQSSDHRDLRLAGHFSELLTKVVPADKRAVAAGDEAVVGSIVTVIADHLRRDRLDRLTASGPDLIHLTLLPYLGFDDAKRWAQSPPPPGARGL
jgi:hypothetical protein